MGGSNERLKYYLTINLDDFLPRLFSPSLLSTPRREAQAHEQTPFSLKVRQTSSPPESLVQVLYVHMFSWSLRRILVLFFFLLPRRQYFVSLYPVCPSPPTSRLHLLYTIYPDNQGPNRDPPLEVQRQRSYTGPYAIPPFLADKKYHSFELQELLDDLNDIMDTSFPLLSPSLYFHLITCMSRDYDLGLAYSYLRPHWFSDFATL